MDILILLGGVIVTGLVQFLKGKTKFSGVSAVAVTVVVSLVAAALYSGLSYYGFWEAFSKVFVDATVIYAVLIKSLKG